MNEVVNQVFMSVFLYNIFSYFYSYHILSLFHAKTWNTLVCIYRFIYTYIEIERVVGGVVIFTTLYAEAGIAYKEIAESLCSRHNVVT